MSGREIIIFEVSLSPACMSMVVFFGGPPAPGFVVENIDHIVVRLIELRLREEWQQVFVAAVAVDDDYFLAAVARHLVGGFLQQGELHLAAVGDGSGLVAGFGDLSEIIFGEDDGVFLLGGVQRGVADVEQIGAQRQMRSVLLQDAEGQAGMCLASDECLRGNRRR